MMARELGVPEVYFVPMLLMIGWREEPSVDDEAST
jgi:hypothetical protein